LKTSEKPIARSSIKRRWPIQACPSFDAISVSETN
jgi:hypothetical protein